MATSKMFIQTQMFIAGLREKLQHRVMESGKTDPLEIFRCAQEMEQIEEEKRRKNPSPWSRPSRRSPTTLDDFINKDSVKLEGLDDQDLEFLNAIRFQKGKPPYRRGQFFNKRASGSRPKKQPIKCRYCKKMGHMQKECKSRLFNYTPEVDTN